MAQIIVLSFAYASLVYTRWKTRRYAAIEARQKEEDAELYPMLKMDDVPFGAKALERGIQIEGIWVSNPNTPIQTPQATDTPYGSRPSSPATKTFLLPSSTTTSVSSFILENTKTDQQSPPTCYPPLPQSLRPAYRPEMDVFTANRYTYEPQRPGGIYSPVITSKIPDSPSKSSRFQRRSEVLSSSEKRASFHTRVRRASHIFEKGPTAGSAEPERMEPGLSSNGSGSQPDEPHRASRITRKSHNLQPLPTQRYQFR